MTLTVIIVYVIAPIIILGYFFLKKKFAYFEENGIPYVKPSWPMGNIGDLGKTKNMADLLKTVYEECKDKDVIAGFFTMFKPSLVITDLELAKQILIKDFNNFTDRGVFENPEKDILTGNMFSVKGDQWRFLRNKLSPVFTSGKIKMMYNVISDKKDNLVSAVEKASKHGSVDMKDIGNRFSVDVTVSCSFGMEPNTLKNEHPEYLQVLKQILGEEGISPIYILFLFAFPNFAKFLNLSQFGRKAEKFFTDVIGGSINYRETNNITRNDFLNMLIQLKNKGSIDGENTSDMRKLTLDQCIAQAFIFFLGGADSSGSSIAFALTELSYHPEIQDKVRKEIIEKTKDSNGEITYDNLNEMTYFNQVMSGKYFILVEPLYLIMYKCKKFSRNYQSTVFFYLSTENLRKFTPNSFLFRQAVKDYQIPGSKHVIRKGMQVLIPSLAYHYDDRYWKNPEVFDPDRFTSEEIAKVPNMAYLPFGEGPRNCIGMR